MTTIFYKDPDAILDYGFDWAAWLAEGETITDFTLTADTGLTIEALPAASESEGVITFWVSDGIAGTNYNVLCQIETSDGRTDERTMRIKVRER